ncbi:hypothetical protein MKX03_024995 [Papaver bracteatum]|nr:hypothetical protein MKX03_024995 [Papaver bracteatum]
MSLTCDVECVLFLGVTITRWMRKRCTYVEDFEPIPRVCRAILAVYEDDLRNPRFGPDCEIIFAIRGLNLVSQSDYKLLLDNRLGMQMFDGGYVVALLTIVVVNHRNQLGGIPRSNVKCYAIAPTRCMSLILAVKYATLLYCNNMQQSPIQALTEEQEVFLKRVYDSGTVFYFVIYIFYILIMSSFICFASIGIFLCY